MRIAIHTRRSGLSRGAFDTPLGIAKGKGWIEAIGQGRRRRRRAARRAAAERIEARLQELEAEIAAAAEVTVDQADVARALSLFDPIWEVLYPLEQERIVQLLIERIDYEAAGKKLGIEPRETGIRSLAAEVATAEEATS